MLLSIGQLQTVKSWVIANAGSVFEQSTADTMNLLATPAYWCWRSQVEKSEVVENVSVDGTSFVWAGNGFISRSVGELECWNQLFSLGGVVNPSLANVRQAFSDIFSGTGNAATNRAHLLTVSRRSATVAEKLLALVATGPGNNGGNPRGATTNPDNFGPGAEGNITLQNLIDASNT